MLDTKCVMFPNDTILVDDNIEGVRRRTRTLVRMEKNGSKMSRTKRNF